MKTAINVIPMVTIVIILLTGGCRQGEENMSIAEKKYEPTWESLKNKNIASQIN